MRVIILTLAISMAITISAFRVNVALAQKAPKITDTTMELYYKNGKVAESGEIKKVKDKPVRHGKWSVFYENGTKGREGTYKDGKKDGLWIQYYKSGTIGMKITYKDNTITGLKELFYKSGKLKKQENYINNTLHGQAKELFENGETKSEGKYIDGKKSGVEKVFYENGKIYSFSNYTRGSLNGPYFKNYKDGKRKMQGRYIPPRKQQEGKKKVEGWKTGRWTFFHSNGKKAMEGNYRNNNRTGKWRIYAPKGYLYAEGMMVDNSESGIWKYFNSNRSMVKRLTLKSGMVEGTGWLYEKNKLVFQGTMTGLPQSAMKNGQGKEFYPNKRVKLIGPYMMNRKSGIFKEFHPNGKLMAQGEYMNDKRNGNWTFYKQDGKTKDPEKSGFYMMGTKNKALSPGGLDFKFKPSWQ